ncbi:hypothetical protein RGQ13_06065 [Thalassotalea psychrophila]|uniref:Nif11 domain-containing protein n=1 Tax=Thalassotalea psychrophila TaxID=3065647 RepID=A0ABY9TYB8_9GAMM|nr:hypothetical protein RGQ13_06065 [Colwelliaceae bacterium SQ149]
MQLEKMLVELRKIKGTNFTESLVSLCDYSNEQVCRQALAGNKEFIVELLRRGEIAEIEGDYLIASELYKTFTKGMI